MNSTEYKHEELNKFSNEIHKVVKLVNHAVNWVDSSLELVDKTPDANKKLRAEYDLKKNRRILKKVKKVVEEKPTVAIFGASQVGKSYFVKNLLADEQNNLFLYDNNNNAYDFISDINPEGCGAEATSVVTRFTFQEKKENELPVSIKLFSVKDLICIIADGYLANIKKKNHYINKDVVQQHINEIKSLISSQNQSILTEDDVFDTADYLKFYEDTNKNIFRAFEELEFWHFLGTNISKINITNFPLVFSILWGGNAVLTELFSTLLSKLQSVNFETIVHSNFDAVLRNKGRILDVTTLLSLENSVNIIQLKGNSNTAYNLPSGYLSALTKEVVFNISQSIKKELLNFMQKMDILDFPGARSREEFSEDIIDTSNQKLRLFLSGKVTYLLNSFSKNYKINTLIVANRNMNTGVRSVPGVINSWVMYNVGETAKERAQVLNGFKIHPLFVLFTFWNTQLTFESDQDINKKTNEIKDDFSYKWVHRFKKIVGEEIFDKNHDWWQEWTPGKKFQNYYLLRDFRYSTDIFDGFDEARMEKNVKSDLIEYYSKLENSFKNSPLVKEFFTNLEEIWAETSTAGKDGTDLIIKNLQQIQINEIKTKRLLSIIDKSLRDSVTILENFFYRDS